MLSAIGSLLGWIFKLIFGSKNPTVADLAASNATAQAELTQEISANVIHEKAAAARASADARRLHEQDGPGNSVDPRPDAPINRDPDGHYRD